MNITFLVTLVVVVLASIFVVYALFFRPKKSAKPAKKPVTPEKAPAKRTKTQTRKTSRKSSSAPVKSVSLDSHERHVTSVTPPGSTLPAIGFCLNKRLLLVIRQDDEHLYAYKTADLTNTGPNASIPLLHAHAFRHGADSEDYPTCLSSSFLAPNSQLSICALALDDSPPGQVIQILRVTNATGALRKTSTVTCCRRFPQSEPISFLHLIRSNGLCLAASGSGSSDTVYMFGSDGTLVREFRSGMLGVDPVCVSPDSVWVCIGAKASGMFECQVRLWGFVCRREQGRAKKISKELVQYLSLDIERRIRAVCFVVRRPKLVLVATNEGLTLIMLKRMKITSSGDRQTGGKGDVVWSVPYEDLGLDAETLDTLDIQSISAHSFSKTGKKRTMVDEGIPNQDIVAVLVIRGGESMICFRCGEDVADGVRQFCRIDMPAIQRKRRGRAAATASSDRVTALQIGPRGKYCMFTTRSGKFRILDITEPELETEEEPAPETRRRKRRRRRKKNRGGRS